MKLRLTTAATSERKLVAELGPWSTGPRFVPSLCPDSQGVPHAQTARSKNTSNWVEELSKLEWLLCKILAALHM